MDTIREITYLGNIVSAGGGFEDAVTARTVSWWAKLLECCELLCGKRLALKLNGAVYRNVRSEILHRSEICSLSENYMKIL